MADFLLKSSLEIFPYETFREILFLGFLGSFPSISSLWKSVNSSSAEFSNFFFDPSKFRDEISFKEVGLSHPKISNLGCD
jgi:hypothetical protein